MQTTVEEVRTVTEEHDLTICDDCGREVDDDGVEYRLDATAFDREDATARHLHYCSEHIPGHEPQEPPTRVERAKDWVTPEHDLALSLSEKAVFLALFALLLPLWIVVAAVDLAGGIDNGTDDPAGFIVWVLAAATGTLLWAGLALNLANAAWPGLI